MRDELAKLLPGGDDGTGRFDMSELHGSAFVRVNINQSDRYVLCAPGELRFRPRPSPRSLVNLHFAGDWTRNGIDIPCMEGVVVSALRVAEAITGEDLEILAERDWI